jgi:hypothetical protein
VLDLHGLTWAEARQEFIDLYNRSARGDSVDAIHGYGASGQGGKLRTALRTFLHNHKTSFTAGEDLDRNPGHTLVYVDKPLPTADDRLHSEILSYCDSPKTKVEIAGRFRRHGDPAVDAALKSLLAQRLLTLAPGSRKRYVRG